MAYEATATKVDPRWSEYDQTVARCHIASYGKIYLDEYGCPIDDEYMLEEIAEKEMGAKEAI